jgi:hypothetical protein
MVLGSAAAYAGVMAVMVDTDVVEQARVDDRPLSRRLLAPLATLGGTAVALGYIAAVDPNQPGHYPLCPTRALFGVDCPGCGLMRGTHDLVTGNVSGALDHNVLIAVLVPLAIVLWIRLFLRSWRGRSPEVTYAQFRRRNRWMLVSLVAMLAFGVIRNFVPYLGSGIG